MVTAKTQPRPAKPAKSRLDYIPPLESGDHLDAAEFLRRYEPMPEDFKAELIQGIVYVTPVHVRAKQHGDPDSLAQGFLCNYAIATPGVKSSTNSTILLGPVDVPQADAHLRIVAGAIGQTQLDKKGYVVGSPQLIFEIAASSASIDTREKLESYRDAGVREYLVWRTGDDEIDWWTLEAGQFVPIEPGADGIARSRVFPGLWLDISAMIAEDGAKVMAVLKEGLASEEHQGFVASLKV